MSFFAGLGALNKACLFAGFGGGLIRIFIARAFVFLLYHR